MPALSKDQREGLLDRGGLDRGRRAAPWPASAVATRFDGSRSFKVTDIERRIAELEAVREALRRLAVSCGEGAAKTTCPFIDELYCPIDPKPDAACCGPADARRS